MAEAGKYSAALIGRTLKLFLVDGTPSGVITAELGISSVRAAVASRTSLPELIRRDEAARTGVYLLVGPDPSQPDRDRVYVGEGDQVKTRLSSHDSDDKKDFFTRAVVIVSKDENITKAHGRYLESRLISTIKIAGRANLENGTEPPFKGLPEPEIADMERVLGEIEIILPVLGFDFLRPAGRDAGLPLDPAPNSPLPVSSVSDPALFIFTESGADAKAREGSGEFVVLKGLLAKASEVNSCDAGIRFHRAQLVADGTLVPTSNDKLLLFSKDVAFGTPSRAACIVYGGSVSGPQYWRHYKTNQTYREWRAAKIARGNTEKT